MLTLDQFRVMVSRRGFVRTGGFQMQGWFVWLALLYLVDGKVMNERLRRQIY